MNKVEELIWKIKNGLLDRRVNDESGVLFIEIGDKYVILKSRYSINLLPKFTNDLIVKLDYDEFEKEREKYRGIVQIDKTALNINGGLAVDELETIITNGKYGYCSNIIDK